MWQTTGAPLWRTGIADNPFHRGTAKWFAPRRRKPGVITVSNDLLPVPFRGATLYLIDRDSEPYAPMKPIVEGMGLDWAAQFTKLKNNQRFASTIAIIATVAEDGKTRDTVCLPLRKLPGWMTSINASKVAPAIRDTVIAYQNECDDALWDYWSKGHAVNPRQPANIPQTFAQALRLAADQQERIEQQQREIEAARPKVAFHDQVVPSESMLDFAQAFSLLHGRTGQTFTRRTFLAFLRRHGIACQPNPHTGVTQERFVPRTAYIGTWFVSEMTPAGQTEWLLRPLAIAGIVALIEQDRLAAPIPITRALPSPETHP